MNLSIDDIVALTGGKILGTTPEIEISGVATLSEACASEASFLGNEKYYQDYLNSSAGLILIPTGLPEHPEGSCYIEVDNPSLAFNALVAHFKGTTKAAQQGISPHAIVHPSVQLNPERVSIAAGAIIEEGVQLGDGCEIGAGCIIGRDCILGENCRLYARVTLRERSQLGKHVTIQPGCVIGSDGFGFLLNKETGYYDTIDQVGIVVIEDHVDIGANTTIDRARFGRTVIGEGTKIDNLVQIGHNVKVGKHCIIVAQTGIAGSTSLGNYVTVAAQCGIAGHLHLADRSVLGAKSGVMTNLEEGQTYWGIPCSPARDTKKQIISMRQLPRMMKEHREMKEWIEQQRGSSE